MAGQKAKWGCCGTTLFDGKVNSVERTVDLSIDGLTLLTPAIILAIMCITLAY